jgi:hypothetical protein
MKTIKNIITATLEILLATITTMAEAPESTMFYMNSRNRYYATKFILASNLIVLPFSINKSDSLNFVFDTGAGRIIITDLSNPQAIPLDKGRKVRVMGLGSKESVEGILSGDNALSMGKIAGESQEILFVPNKTIDLSSGMGHRIHGLIGRSIFERFVVEISYTNKTVKFYEGKNFNRRIRKNEEVIPIELIDGRPFITAQVTINGNQFPVKLLFDTGMSFALWLDPTSNANIKPSLTSRHDAFGNGLNGAVMGEISRVEKFQIGKFEFNNVITAFPDSNNIGDVTANTDRNGSVGADIFRRFNVTIDYQNKRIILSKNNSYKEPFAYDMSGIEVGTIIPGFPLYRIVSVGNNTPASECGLMENDVLNSINGQQVSSLSLCDITSMLKSKEGRKIKITILRNGEIIKVNFKLRKLV